MYRLLLILAAALSLMATSLFAEPSADQLRLQALFDKDWEFRLAEFPTLATYTGSPGAHDKLESVAEKDQLRRADFWRGILAELLQ